MKMVLVRKKHPGCRGPAASWDEVQVEPAWIGAGMVHKGKVKVRLQEAAVHPTHPSTRLDLRLPLRQGESHGTGWELWSQIPKVQRGPSKDLCLCLSR